MVLLASGKLTVAETTASDEAKAGFLGGTELGGDAIGRSQTGPNTLREISEA
jgi:hypothetical protein